MTTLDPATMRPPALTYLGVPASGDASGARCAILGVPYDCGLDPWRVGARLGPQSIREQSRNVRRHLSLHGRIDVVGRLGLIDCGDVAAVPGNVEVSYPRIERAVHAIAAAGAVVVALGGDGSVTLPQLRALRKVHPELCVLHIDAHADCYRMPGYDTLTTFARAAEEQLVDTGRTFHIGCHGSTSFDSSLQEAATLGYPVVPLDLMLADGIRPTLERLRTAIGGRPVHVCFDMDAIDASCAPGVCAPTWGGLLSREALALVRALAGFNLVSFDINTVSPPHDVAGMTAFLAATLVHEFLYVLAKDMPAA